MSNEIPEEKVEIGGWLVLVGILLWFGAIGGAFSTLFAVLSLTSHADYMNVILQILAWVICVAMLIMFHRRNKSFVKWVFIYESIVFIQECYHLYLKLAYQVQGNAGRSAVVIGVFVIALLEILLVVLYVVRSKRVKQTFIR